MSLFSINGIERDLPLAGEESFGSLLRYVHLNLTNENTLISSVRVDGKEIGEEEEQSLRTVPLSELNSIEITFAKPKELADETLHILKLFAMRLADLSQACADQLAVAPASLPGTSTTREYRKLLDGLQVFCDTIQNVKLALHLGVIPEVDALEKQMLKTMHSMLHAQATGDARSRMNLLGSDLPRDLEDWNRVGIPALVRSRDN